MGQVQFKFEEKLNHKTHWDDEEVSLLKVLYQRPLPIELMAKALHRTAAGVRAKATELSLGRDFKIMRGENSTHYQAYIESRNNTHWKQEDIDLARWLHERQVDLEVISAVLGRTSERCVKRIIKRGHTGPKTKEAPTSVVKKFPETVPPKQSGVIDDGSVSYTVFRVKDLSKVLDILNGLIEIADEKIEIFTDEEGKVRARVIQETVV